MIKAEVVFDGDTLTVNGRKFYVFAEYGYDTYCKTADEKEFDTIEEAVSWCQEQSK